MPHYSAAVSHNVKTVYHYITRRTTTNTGHCAVIQTILIQSGLPIIGMLCVRLKAVEKVMLKLKMMSNNDDDDDDDDDDDERHNNVRWPPQDLSNYC